MKKRSVITMLAILSFAAIAHADDNPIDIPADATSDSPGIAVPNANASDFPNSTKADDYVNYFSKSFESAKKQAVRAFVAKYPYAVNNFCLNHNEAVGYTTNGNKLEVRCFSGTTKNITHILQYEVNITYSSSDCGNIDTLTKFFKANPPPNSAQIYLNSMRSCMLSITPVPGTQISSFAISADDVNKKLALPQYQDLKTYVGATDNNSSVNSSHKKKDAGLSDLFGDGFSNPQKQPNSNSPQ